MGLPLTQFMSFGATVFISPQGTLGLGFFILDERHVAAFPRLQAILAPPACADRIHPIYNGLALADKTGNPLLEVGSVRPADLHSTVRAFC